MLGMKAHPEIAPWFFGVWIALAIVGLWNTYLDKNIARKKRLLPVFTIGAGVIFAVFTLLMMGSNLRMLAFVIPAVVLITFLNLRQIRVCSACGKTIHSGMWLSKARSRPERTS